MERQNTRKKRLLFLAAAVWLILIFCFSSQEADDSSEVSGTIAYKLVEKTDALLDFEWGEEELIERSSAIEFPLRKAAHMTEYAILACIMLANFMLYEKTAKRPFLYAELFCAAYAATDEFHQLFVKGRAGQLRDVGIDSIGAAVGLLLAWTALKVYNNARRNRDRKR